MSSPSIVNLAFVGFCRPVTVLSGVITGSSGVKALTGVMPSPSFYGTASAAGLERTTYWESMEIPGGRGSRHAVLTRVYFSIDGQNLLVGDSTAGAMSQIAVFPQYDQLAIYAIREGQTGTSSYPTEATGRFLTCVAPGESLHDLHLDAGDRGLWCGVSSNLRVPLTNVAGWADGEVNLGYASVNITLRLDA